MANYIWMREGGGKISLKCVKKECVNNCNRYDDVNGDYCVLVGTYILNGRTGKDVIKEILSGFEPSSISQLKHDMIGMWAAIVSKGRTTYFFNDYFGLYDICYSRENDRIIISTSLKDVALNVEKAEYDEFPFVMEAFQTGSFPNDTIYKGIKKLLGSEFLVYVDDGKLEKKSIPVDEYLVRYTYKNEQTALSDLSNMLKHYAKEVSDAFGKIGMFLTGGLDSRLVFASYHIVGADIKCKFGVGNSSQDGDRKAVKEICSAYDKQLEFMDWSSVENTVDDQNKVFEKFGFSNWFAGGCRRHYEAFGESAKAEPFFAFGYFCEALRLRDWAEEKGHFFSLTDYVDDYYVNPKLKNCYSNYQAYRDYLYSHYVEDLKDMGYTGDLDRIPVDLFESFRWRLSRFCDSRTEFLLNVYSYAFSLLSVPKIHTIILSLPASVIKNGRFQIKLIATIDRSMLDIDVYSHLRPYRITKDLRKRRLLSMKAVADDVFKLVPFIKPFLIRLYRNKRYNLSEERQTSIGLIADMGSIPYINISEYDGDLSRLRAIIIGNNYIMNNGKI